MAHITPSNGRTWIDRHWTDIVRVSGLGITFWQLLLDNVDRPYLLGLAGGMISLKEVKKWQDKKNGG